MAWHAPRFYVKLPMFAGGGGEGGGSEQQRVGVGKQNLDQNFPKFLCSTTPFSEKKISFSALEIYFL